MPWGKRAVQTSVYDSCTDEPPIYRGSGGKGVWVGGVSH